MLDINTPAGQKTLKQEQRAYEILAQHHPDTFVAHTPKDSAAKVDGFLVRGNVVAGIVETKCRKATLEQMADWGSWLVTNVKIEHIRKMSSVLKVPGYGLLYLVPDDALMLWQITDDAGTYSFDFEVKRTKTRATVNGGVAFRKNAFLPVADVSAIYHPI